jgi:predicted ATP-dependent serine protease
MKEFQNFYGQPTKIQQIKDWINEYNQFILDKLDKSNKLNKINNELKPVKPVKSIKTGNILNIESKSGKKGTNPAKKVEEKKTVKEKKEHNDIHGETSKKFILLTGNSGTGKTFLGEIIVKVLKKRPITIELGERQIKKLFEQTIKYHNILDYMIQTPNANEQIKSANQSHNVCLWLNDLDTLVVDSGIYGELMDILRENTFSIPIIATAKECDKRIQEIRKYATEIRMSRTGKHDMERWLQNYYKEIIVTNVTNKQGEEILLEKTVYIQYDLDIEKKTYNLSTGYNINYTLLD